MADRPVLLPVPRHVEWSAGFAQIPGELFVVVSGSQQELWPAVTRFKRFAETALGVPVSVVASTRGLDGQVFIHVDANAHAVDDPQGYRLTVTEGAVRVEASSAEGAAYGLATLKQLVAGAGRRVPCVTIEDHPDFPRRGVMLDISRGKVPTMETLYGLVDLLADLKVNEFQLYTEHTFAYRGREEVWQNYSPLTGEQILALDRYCRERFIDLVPNQNSFGHMKEWLVHPRYRHMAEVTEGWTGWGIWFDGPFSFSPVEPSVIPFLGELYDELLPHFSSQYFNVGCDETLDVGQGKSKEAVAQFGEHRVYVDMLLKIYEQVKARGKTMMFWGDIINKAPEYIAELPKDVIALEWGYEASHPFDETCGNFARAGVPFYVCPGTSTWNSLVGRTDNAMANMLSAAENGLKHGAIGYLNTMWGDRGHQDYQPVTYLGIAYGAAVSWGLEANRDADVASFLSQLVFGDRAGKIGRVLYDMGNLYKAVGFEPFNGSVFGYLLHHGFERPRTVGSLTPANFEQAALRIREVAAGLDQVQLTCADASLVMRELRNAVRMLLHACELGKIRTAEEPVAPAVIQAQIVDLDAIIAEHRNLWLERNRIGGLEEMSLAPFYKLREGYVKRLG